jgi:hypothetical protein
MHFVKFYLFLKYMEAIFLQCWWKWILMMFNNMQKCIIDVVTFKKECNFLKAIKSKFSSGWLRSSNTPKLWWYCASNLCRNVQSYATFSLLHFIHLCSWYNIKMRNVTNSNLVLAVSVLCCQRSLHAPTHLLGCVGAEVAWCSCIVFAGFKRETY